MRRLLLGRPRQVRPPRVLGAGVASLSLPKSIRYQHMFKPASAVVLVAALLSSLGAYAQITDLKGAEFQRQAEQVRSDLSSSDKYAEITADDRATVLSLLNRMESRLAEAPDVEGLADQAKISIFNDQEQVNEILTGAAADSRQTCRREIVVGSNRRQNVCMTVAERRRLSERSREDMGDMQRLFGEESR